MFRFQYFKSYRHLWTFSLVIWHSFDVHYVLCRSNDVCVSIFEFLISFSRHLRDWQWGIFVGSNIFAMFINNIQQWRFHCGWHFECVLSGWWMGWWQFQYLQFSICSLVQVVVFYFWYRCWPFGMLTRFSVNRYFLGNLSISRWTDISFFCVGFTRFSMGIQCVCQRQ